MLRTAAALVLILAALGCVTSDRDDPIVGYWSDPECMERCDQLWFEPDGALTLLPWDDGVTSLITPNASWRRDSANYRLSYDWPGSWRRDTTATAVINNDVLLVTSGGAESRYVRGRRS